MLYSVIDQAQEAYFIIFRQGRGFFYWIGSQVYSRAGFFIYWPVDFSTKQIICRYLQKNK